MKPLLLVWILLMATPAAAKECVVLLHGLARSSASMLLMEWRLKREGYEVVNLDYPSTDYTIERLAEETIPRALEACREAGAAPVHFVTHSMGGILLRYYLADPARRPGDLGRVVMLGPPNQGTPIIDKLADLPGFELWNGPAGLQLGTGPESLPRKLPPVDYPVGIIAGTQVLNPLLAALIDEPNDGKVPVDSTKVEGMADFVALPVTHTFMMNNPAVQEQVLAFLREGRFLHD